jgi:hypothetical protein
MRQCGAPLMARFNWENAIEKAVEISKLNKSLRAKGKDQLRLQQKIFSNDTTKN